MLDPVVDATTSSIQSWSYDTHSGSRRIELEIILFDGSCVDSWRFARATFKTSVELGNETRRDPAVDIAGSNNKQRRVMADL